MIQKTFIYALFLLLFIQANAQPDTIVAKVIQRFTQGRPWLKVSAAVIMQHKTSLFNNDSAVYEIGSITKSFASIVLAHAVLEKKVKLHDDIRLYLEGSYPNLAYNGKTIELLHLVNLTSGLPNNMPDKEGEFNNLPTDSVPFAIGRRRTGYTRQRLLKDLHAVTLDTVPGFIPRHSNAAARLLVYILENIYHQPYPMLLEKYILGPLHMNNTGLRRSPRLVTGHNAQGLPMPNVTEGDAVAFGLQSTIADMARYLRYQLNEKDSAVKMAHQVQWGDPAGFGIGMGWLMDYTGDGQRKIYGNGTTFACTSYILMYPGRQFGIVLLANVYDSTSSDRLAVLAQQVFEECNYTPAQRASDGFGFSTGINTLLKRLEKKGFGQAIAAAAGLKLGEMEVNGWAYALLAKGKREEALEIFKLNVSLYPNSANTYDSLGEIYADLGDRELAVKNYQRSLELNPQNSNAAEQLKKLQAP